MFKISDFSKICRVPASSLRYYANIGLLEPGYIDPMTGYRYYTFDQLPRLHRILALKDLGMSLEQIALLLNDEVTPSELRGMLRMKQAEIEQHIEEQQTRLTRVAARLQQIEQEGKMPEQEIILKTVEPQHVLSIREVVPTHVYVGTLMLKATMAISSKGVTLISPPYTIFHDDEFKQTNMDIEIVLPVDKNVTSNIEMYDNSQLSVRETENVPLVASLIHRGDYATLEASYETLGQWINANGYRIVGAAHEIYLRPMDKEGIAVVELQFPVAKI